MKKEKKGFNKGRRSFLKGSLTVGAAGMFVGMAGIAPGTAEGASAGAAPGSCKKYSFDTPPAPIPASSIVARKSADVVVLGAGLAGLCAAYAAAEKGAKVVLLEKRETFTFHGGWNAAVDDRLHKAKNIKVPKDKIMAEVMRFGAYHPNPRLIKLWLDENGRIMDRLLDLADAAGVKYFIDTNNKSYWPYTEFPTAIQFLPGWNFTLCSMLEKYVKAKGVEIMYQTPAAQLIRKNKKSKVTGVIAKGKDGYIQVDAAKGVILCTGCYVNNREMFEKYSPRCLKIVGDGYPEGSNTGDGILMGMWVGGVKQETDCPMLWDGFTAIPGGFRNRVVNLARQPFLNVNLLGERYANEDAPFGYTANQDIQQPGGWKWTVWDANWNTDKDKMHGTVCENMINTPLWNDKEYERFKKQGVIVEADTIEKLADKMQVPRDTFVATVKRYNQLVQKGVDEDFGKDPAKLTAIVKPPFGACKTGAGLLVTMDGLRINTDLQVLDVEGKPIPGLYAAGNASGDFFANDYPITTTGISHGRAYAFGWLAGEKVADLKG
ncbi:MAG TPA: FAD-dependent oxidoreductase [Deltaproteobacteria bacterium]|jgi:fumarate reductase flavoprotein subunit|nr:FAD-dependent oxidoreductase [Deltaproteobacteria bacterium]HOI08455.1 FAD-dependent oxidoreductase [Deltaproteobacteria bacterium]